MKAEWSNEIFAKNLKKYMQLAGKNQAEMAKVAGVSAPTYSDWIHAKKMPRMDKIERLADYFGILKSDLIEEKINPAEQGALEGMILRDAELMDMIQKYMSLDENKKKAIRQMVDTLSE